MGTQLTARQGEARRRVFARRERELAALANRQHGVVSRQQLLATGMGVRTIRRRVAAGRLRCLHRGVYVFGGGRVGPQGEWMGAVLACGEDALLSHCSAAGLWGLVRFRRPIEVSAPRGRGRRGLTVHEGGIDRADRAIRDGIPATTVARTLFDLAEVVEEERLEAAFEEADRLHLLEVRALEEVCARGHGRRALRPIRRLVDAAREPLKTRSPLEDRFAIFCREHGLPEPATNVLVLDHEVDAFWPAERLIVEIDGFGFHSHRAAFERDRARDAARQAAGFSVVRLTHRRLEEDAAAVAEELRRLLAPKEGRAAT